MIISEYEQLERIIQPEKICNIRLFKPITGFSLNSRSINPNQAFFAVRGKHCDGHDFIQMAVDKGAVFIIAEKYVKTIPKVSFFIVEDTYKSLEKVSAYIRKKNKCIVYGITGSIGKTTTKEILSFLLEPYFKVLKNFKTENNIFGVAKTIFSLTDEKILILELGTNAKGEIEQLGKMSSPDIGIITFIKPVHLEGLKDLKGVFKEKVSFIGVNPKMKVILNRGDVYLRKIKSSSNIYWFGKDKKNYLSFVRASTNDNGSVFMIQGKYELRLPKHLDIFIVNFLAAISGAHILGIPLKCLVERANLFKEFPDMRMNMIESNGLYILNDAYNANPFALREALRSLKSYPFKKIAVIGDMLELGNKSIYYHESVANEVIKNNFEYCLTYGDYCVYLTDKLKKIGFKKTKHFNSHKEIVKFIKDIINFKSCRREKYLIFLKGSRNMELEKVVQGLID